MHRGLIAGMSALAFMLVAAPAAFAAEQTTAAPAASTETAPVSGSNSFTEGQAKSRIEKAGYQNVSPLKQDDKGVWRGTAEKDGKSTPVALDFKGNVVSE